MRVSCGVIQYESYGTNVTAKNQAVSETDYEHNGTAIRSRYPGGWAIEVATSGCRFV